MTIPQAPPPPAIVSPEQVPPEQRRPPARSQGSIFSDYPLLAFQPACSQLIAQNNGGGVTWVVEMPDGTMNPLAITEPMEQPRAFAAMDASGICKNKGAIVPIMTLQDWQYRMSVIQVEPTINLAPDGLDPMPWLRMGLIGLSAMGLSALALSVFVEKQQTGKSKAPSTATDKLYSLLGETNDR